LNRGNITLISKEKSSWKVRVEIQKDCITGKRKQKCYTVYGTKKEAQIFLTEKLRELDTGLLINTKDMEFCDYLDFWIEESCANRLKITTIDSYKHNIDKYIKPNIGNIELQKLMPLHLQNFYKQCMKTGLSNKTVVNIHRIIHCALEKAVKWQLVIRNVADSVEPPKPIKYKAKFLDEKQTLLLLEKSKTSDIYIPIAIAIYTGMRRGEILGLTWDNVDFINDNIEITKALNDTSEGLQYLNPKTSESARNIIMPETLVRILKAHKIDQQKNKMRLGQFYNDNNAVCCYADGRLFNPKRFSHKFHDLLEANSLSIIRFHDLRHSHASLLVKLGVQPKVISERLGHSNIATTMDLYSHIYEDTHKEVANAFDILISNKVIS
jgi:integrase